MTTAYEDERFIDEIISNTLLEESIEWIKKNLKPEDVFLESDLISWAADNGYSLEHRGAEGSGK